jgi:hypothetical protein
MRPISNKFKALLTSALVLNFVLNYELYLPLLKEIPVDFVKSFFHMTSLAIMQASCKLNSGFVALDSE